MSRPPDPVDLIRQAFDKRIPASGNMPYVRISGVGHECLRKIVFDTRQDLYIEEAVGEKVPALIGNTLHLFYEDICRLFVDEYADAVIEERAVDHILKCTGQIDVFHQGTVIDFKTTSNNNFKKLAKSKKLQKQYMWQMQGYMMMKDAEHGYVVYIDRDTRLSLRDNMDYHPMFSIYVEPDKDIQKSIKERISLVHLMNDLGLVPPKNPKYNKKYPPCSWCDYKGECW